MAQIDPTNPNLQEIIGLDRQRQLSKMLLQQGMQQPQGEMVSGRYVAPAFTQRLANLLSIYGGQKGLEQADIKQQELADQLRRRQEAATQELANSMFGAPAQYVPQGEPLAGEMVTPAVQANPQEAFRKAMLYADVPQIRAMLPTIAEQIMPKTKKPMVVAPGGALVSETGQLLYQAPYKPEAGAGAEDGGYNKKGDWITPNGIFIGKSEVSKDREIAFTADQVRQGLKQITPEDVKKAASVFGNVTGSGPINYLVQRAGNEAVSAQAKINASAVMQILNNLPPGPASDKDIENARSTFPGYGNEKALNDWIKNTRESLDRKVNSLNQKYGSENWFGNTGLSTTPTPAGQDKVVDFNSLPKRK